MTERRHATVEEDSVRAAISSIGAHARTANLGRAEQLDEALTHLESGNLTGPQRDAAVRSAHQLAGSAGTFGLAAASRLASWFERFFGLGESAGPPDVAEARVHLAELRTRLDDSPEVD